MDSEYIYAIVGILILVIVIVVTLNSNPAPTRQTKEEKKAKIIQEYQRELSEMLQKYSDNRELQLANKSKLLKKFSDELARNIFFDGDEIRGIILELSKR